MSKDNSCKGRTKQEWAAEEYKWESNHFIFLVITGFLGVGLFMSTILQIIDSSMSSLTLQEWFYHHGWLWYVAFLVLLGMTLITYYMARRAKKCQERRK